MASLKLALYESITYRVWCRTRVYRGAGIDGASSHSGRRSFATALASRGVGVRVLMRAMGHRNISTTIGYIDASDDMLRRAVSLV